MSTRAICSLLISIAAFSKRRVAESAGPPYQSRQCALPIPFNRRSVLGQTIALLQDDGCVTKRCCRSVGAVQSRIVHHRKELDCGKFSPLRWVSPESSARVAGIKDETGRGFSAWHLDRTRFAYPPRRPRVRVNLSLYKRFEFGRVRRLVVHGRAMILAATELQEAVHEAARSA